jgi:hypothetical protein
MAAMAGDWSLVDSFVVISGLEACNLLTLYIRLKPVRFLGFIDCPPLKSGGN